MPLMRYFIFYSAVPKHMGFETVESEEAMAALPFLLI